MRSVLIRVIAVVLLLVFTGLLYHRYYRQNLHTANFIINLPHHQISMNAKPIFESDIIPQPRFLPAAHSSSFTMLENGNLLAFWFAGTKEGNPDVKIWHSLYHNESWSMATSMLDPQMIAKANHRYVVKVGNPVVYRALNGTLHLFVVSVSIGGWSGSTLNHLVSFNDGKTWSEPERVVISPFFNISTLVRTNAVTLSDGSFYLPVYHEFIRKYPELLLFNAQGRFVEQIRITSKNRMLQPSVVPISETTAWAFFRNSEQISGERKLFAAQTFNSGRSWQKPVATNLTNPDSSIEAINLGNGQLLMVYNPHNREQLWLATSKDGLNWQPVYCLENKSGDEFSYPSMHVDGDFIDILYTNNRKNIKHVRFNRAWLEKEVLIHARN